MYCIYCIELILRVSVVPRDLAQAQLEFLSLKRRKVAVLVGCDGHPSIGAEVDCESMRRLLVETCGFDVVLTLKGIQASSQEVTRACIQGAHVDTRFAAEELEPLVLFYFAGHAVVQEHELLLGTADPRETVIA